MIYKVNSTEETKKVAETFAKTLKPGMVVLLNGDLGAGKTTFTQFVFASLGVKQVVSSPTFAILKSYDGKFKLHHFDTYRITTEEAIESGFDEIFQEKDSVIFVEWSENIAPLIPEKTIKINIKYLNENNKKVTQPILASMTSTGDKSIVTGLKELKDEGYLVIDRKNIDGIFVYTYKLLK